MYFEGSDAECHEFYFDLGDEVGSKTVKLKGNHIPKGLMNLERLFNRRYCSTNKTLMPNKNSSNEYEKINIGNDDDPKLVNLGTCCSMEEKVRLENLLKEFKDGFA